MHSSQRHWLEQVRRHPLHAIIQLPLCYTWPCLCPTLNVICLMPLLIVVQAAELLGCFWSDDADEVAQLVTVPVTNRSNVSSVALLAVSSCFACSLQLFHS